MRAVGAGPGDEVDAPLDEQSRAGVLHRGRQRMHAHDLLGVLARGEPEHHRRHVGGLAGGGQTRRDLVGVPTGGVTSTRRVWFGPDGDPCLEGSHAKRGIAG